MCGGGRVHTIDAWAARLAATSAAACISSLPIRDIKNR